MPMVTVYLKSDEKVLDLKKATEEISAETGIAPEHLTLFAQRLSPTGYYKGSGTLFPTVRIAARAGNGPEVIQKLMKAAAKAVADQLHLDAANITVYTHAIEDGYLLLGGNIM